MEALEKLVNDLRYRDRRENALHQLSTVIDLSGVHYPNMAPILWKSFGAVNALLEEIISVYRFLSPPRLTGLQSVRVGNAINILRSLAAHRDTRMWLLNAHIPLYLQPYLFTTDESFPIDNLRCMSLGVFGALLKDSDTDTDVLIFLLSTEIIPLCLRSMKIGGESSKAIAAYILVKIMVNDVGLQYICTTPERFFAVVDVLESIVAKMAQQPSLLVLKQIIGCYLRLCDHPNACAALGCCLPLTLRDETFTSCLQEDPSTARLLQALLVKCKRLV